MTVLACLVAKESDTAGYTTYVFECLEDFMFQYSKYIMCTRFPNWDHRNIDLGEVGYLNFMEIRAGIDKWYDGSKMVPYNYNNVQFLKFIEKPRIEKAKFVCR